MPESGLIFLVFAPATVGLVVTLLRRLPPSIYWVSLGGISTLELVSLHQIQGASGNPEFNAMAFAILFLVIPTTIGFWVGRLVLLDRGGAWLFTVTSSAYLFALGLAVAISALSKALGP